MENGMLVLIILLKFIIIYLTHEEIVLLIFIPVLYLILKMKLCIYDADLRPLYILNKGQFIIIIKLENLSNKINLTEFLIGISNFKYNITDLESFQKMKLSIKLILLTQHSEYIDPKKHQHYLFLWMKILKINNIHIVKYILSLFWARRLHYSIPRS